MNKLKRRTLLVTILIIVGILLIVMTWAFSRYRSQLSSYGSSKIAKPICTLYVNPHQSQDNEINSYCDVEVKNYDSENNVSEVAMDYSIEIKNESGENVSEYYWEDEQGNNLGKNLTGSFDNTDKAQKKYKVYFVNSGENEKTEKINFVIHAVQKI